MFVGFLALAIFFAVTWFGWGALDRVTERFLARNGTRWRMRACAGLTCAFLVSLPILAGTAIMKRGASPRPFGPDEDPIGFLLAALLVFGPLKAFIIHWWTRHEELFGSLTNAVGIRGIFALPLVVIDFYWFFTTAAIFLALGGFPFFILLHILRAL